MAHASISIHAAPTAVDSYPENDGSVTIKFGADRSQEVRFFTGSAQLARDLHQAIAGVLDRHPITTMARLRREAT